MIETDTSLKFEDEKLVCVMLNGGKLSSGARDFLYENAAWMRLEQKHKIRLQHPMCTAVMESDLKVVNYMGVGAVAYSAMLHHPNGYTKVNFIVRINHMDEDFPTKSSWKKVQKTSNDPRIVELVENFMGQFFHQMGDHIENYEVKHESFEIVDDEDDNN